MTGTEEEDELVEYSEEEEQQQLEGQPPSESKNEYDENSIVCLLTGSPVLQR